MQEIIITVLYEGREVVLHTREGEYRNLMMLLYDRIYIEGFGECRGMGRCGTCLIEMIGPIAGGSDADLYLRDRNENTTLLKMGISDRRMRLACQIRIDESLHNVAVAVIEC
jgi:2Fe-2S ferredoxin